MGKLTGMQSDYVNPSLHDVTFSHEDPKEKVTNAVKKVDSFLIIDMTYEYKFRNWIRGVMRHLTTNAKWRPILLNLNS